MLRAHRDTLLQPEAALRERKNLSLKVRLMPYTLVEHRHRFAAWAAGRAAGTLNCRFKVEEGRLLLEGTEVPKYAADWNFEPETPEEFDAQHRHWRTTMIARANANNIGRKSECFTHGVAAKLINIYLKSMLVCSVPPASKEISYRIGLIHPPIDRLLLEALGKHAKAAGAEPKRGRNQWQYYAKLGWSSFSSEQYEEVIREIRAFANGRPLWQVEEHWIGHQTSSKFKFI